MLGKLWLHAGRRTRARREFEHAVDCGNSEFSARIALCRIELSEGNVGRAEEQIRRARACDPERFLRLEAPLRDAWALLAPSCAGLGGSDLGGSDLGGSGLGAAGSLRTRANTELAADADGAAGANPASAPQSADLLFGTLAYEEYAEYAGSELDDETDEDELDDVDEDEDELEEAEYGEEEDEGADFDHVWHAIDEALEASADFFPRAPYSPEYLSPEYLLSEEDPYAEGRGEEFFEENSRSPEDLRLDLEEERRRLLELEEELRRRADEERGYTEERPGYDAESSIPEFPERGEDSSGGSQDLNWNAAPDSGELPFEFEANPDFEPPLAGFYSELFRQEELEEDGGEAPTEYLFEGLSETEMPIDSDEIRSIDWIEFQARLRAYEDDQESA
jgi:hypothetical protein